MEQMPELDRVTGYVLKQAHAALRAEMDAALRPIGMTVAQYACLEVLAQGEQLSSAQLARATFVTRQSMNVMLTALESTGRVEQAPGDHRGRALPYRITARGRAALRPAHVAVQDVEKRMTQLLDDAEQEQLRTLLRACIRGLRSNAADGGDRASRTLRPPNEL